MMFTVGQWATGAGRKAKQRRRVDPRWIEDCRTTRASADEQIGMMAQIARDDRARPDAEAAHGDLLAGVT